MIFIYFINSNFYILIEYLTSRHVTTLYKFKFCNMKIWWMRRLVIMNKSEWSSKVQIMRRLMVINEFECCFNLFTRKFICAYLHSVLVFLTSSEFLIDGYVACQFLLSYLICHTFFK